MRKIITLIRRLVDAVVINFRNIRLRRYLPLLRLWIELPFVEIRTEIMSQNDYAMSREYINLYLRVWKWRFQFGLYDTEKRIRERSY